MGNPAFLVPYFREAQTHFAPGNTYVTIAAANNQRVALIISTNASGQAVWSLKGGADPSHEGILLGTAAPLILRFADVGALACREIFGASTSGGFNPDITVIEVLFDPSSASMYI